MVFSSATFMFCFLPAVIALYFACPARAGKNIILLLFSLLFYAWGEPVYVLLMLCSIVCNWIFGILVERLEEFRKKACLAAAVAFNLAVIGFFKYESFVAECVNTVVGFYLIPDLHLPLPIGISFYTLQALSYVIDVYRGNVAAQRNVLYLGMYVSFFPQLIAGPIVRYQTIAEQIEDRKETLEGFSSGLRLFIVGLSKKVLLANVVAILATDLLEQGGSSIGMVGAWAGLLAFSFQLYFDFAGYSDMAIGLGRMFGFTYLRNFNYPYISRNVTEFWRRWHISLSSFFRDYLYIPLGGNRVKKSRWVLNILIVWAVTGLWHGAAWNYVLWGIYYGVLLLGEKMIWGRLLAKTPRVIQHLYSIVIIMFGWLLFWIEDPDALVEYAHALFGAYGLYGTSTLWQLGAGDYLSVLVICAIASTPIVPWARARFENWVKGTKYESIKLLDPKELDSSVLCRLSLEDVLPSRGRVTSALLVMVDSVLICMMALSVISIVSGSFNPFIYFKF